MRRVRHPAVPPTQRNHQICVHDVSTVLCVSVARRLMTVTAASDKRISGFSVGEDVIFEDDRGINKLHLRVIKQC